MARVKGGILSATGAATGAATGPATGPATGAATGAATGGAGGAVLAERAWRWQLLLVWLLVAAVLLKYRWPQINFFVLGDTDDNLRIAQVRAWIGGQSWYDLRQYRLNPPVGADIHWSRLVDLPLAGLILALRPLIGGIWAEKMAIGIAPLLPLLVAMYGAALTVRRLFAPWMWIVGVVLLLCGFSALGMFMPTRIDHHGWQLAFLTLNVAGLVDPKTLRGGLTVGMATALSLVIGLEMLPYLAIIGAGLALRWVFDGAEKQRVRGFGLSLSGGTALGYLVFASNANHVARCDALTPVWLSIFVLIGALIAGITWIKTDHRAVRFGLLAGIGVLVGGIILIFWPHCLSRPEGISPELERLWFSQITEVKPSYKQRLPIALGLMVVPLTGMIGSMWMLWRSRRGADFIRWLPLILLSVGSFAMLLWQSRAGPASQVLALSGTGALCYHLIPPLRRSESLLVRVFGVVAAFTIFSGLGPYLAIGALPLEKTTLRQKTISKASGSCPSMAAMRPIARLPKTTIFTFVDLGPRLIVVTHHSAIAGPYHRNGDAILDVHHAFDGTPDNARAIIAKHKATLLLICPNMPESTLYSTRSPGGFYAQLDKGTVPNWLEPVTLPPNSPFKLWRVKAQ
jgi:hypothetical protein